MKKAIISVSITAVAFALCLCGVFLHRGSTPEQKVTSVFSGASTPFREFSLRSAAEYLSLCQKAYHKDSLQHILGENGYGEFQYFERNQYSPSGSGIALGIAAKVEGSRTQLILIIRGTYKGEWYSNFDIGTAPTHLGFSKAADFAEEKLMEYLRDHSLSEQNLSVIITGHSRGGAVANLLGKRLIDKNTYADITAYTFASPNTTTAEDARSTAYSGIYNIQNPEDFICYIPLEHWGYTKYGTILTLPNGDYEGYEEAYAAMQAEFRTLSGYPHTGYPMGHSDVRIFLRSAAELAPTIEDYYTREFSLPPYRLTLSAFMERVAALLSGDDPLSNGMFLVSSGATEEFAPMTEFMMEGITLEDVAESGDITSSAINCGHTYETYRAWLGVLDEEYFLNISGKGE